MTPVTSSARRMLSTMGLWFVAGGLLAWAMVNSELAGWAAALLWAVPMAVCLGFVAASAFYVARTLGASSRSTWQTPLAFGAASAFAGGLWVALCGAWNALGGNLWALVHLDSQAAGVLVAVSPGSGVMLALWMMGAAAYLISLLLYDIGQTGAQLRAAREREALSHLQARDAQLQVLRAQINPHFLFNSLNSISALTSQDASAARAMTLELAAFFRATLALADTDHIALSQEIALCTHFLAVEKIRFGERLKIRLDVSEAASAARIPPMLLQPCVENAVKHGIRHLSEGGCVALRAWVQEAWLYVLITNPTDPDLPLQASNGTGLVNIRKRLATLYGERARLTWTQHAELFSLEIVLPFDPSGVDRTNLLPQEGL